MKGMIIMKKIIAVLCAGIMACTAASCGNNSENSEDVQQNIPSQTESVQNENKDRQDEVSTSAKENETETDADTESKAERSADESNTETEADADKENSQ